MATARQRAEPIQISAPMRLRGLLARSVAALTDAPKLPERVSLLGGAVVLQGGEWLDAETFEYTCSWCNRLTNYRSGDCAPICPACCGVESRVYAKGGHEFGEWLGCDDGEIRCRNCWLLAPEGWSD